MGRVFDENPLAAMPVFLCSTQADVPTPTQAGIAVLSLGRNQYSAYEGRCINIMSEPLIPSGFFIRLLPYPTTWGLSEAVEEWNWVMTLSR
jgi:hypothetical protein